MDDFSSSAHPLPPELSRAQYELAGAWSSLLLVAASNEHVFHLSSPAHHSELLNGILEALESQLRGTAAVSDVVVAIATELSMLYMVLSRKWSCDSIKIGQEVVCTFNNILQSSGTIETHVSMEMMALIYSSLVQLLRNNIQGPILIPICMSHSHVIQFVLVPLTDNLEPRFIMGLIPYVSDTLQKHHVYLSLDSNHRVCELELNTFVYTLTHVHTHSPM